MTNLISGKEALIAFANGVGVQISHKNETLKKEWHDLYGTLMLSAFDSDIYEFRLKPRIITINGIKVPAPFLPDEGELFFHIAPEHEKGYARSLANERNETTWQQFGAWRTEEEIKQVVAALRQIFGGCVMTEYKITKLKDLLNIPVDRIDDCLDELKDGLKLMHAQMAAFEIPVADGVFDSFTWKDDGAKDMTSNAHFSCGGVVQVKVDRND